MTRGVSCRSGLPGVHSSEPRHTISLGHHTLTSGWSWWDANQVSGSPGELTATSYTVGGGGHRTLFPAESLESPAHLVLSSTTGPMPWALSPWLVPFSNQGSKFREVQRPTEDAQLLGHSGHTINPLPGHPGGRAGLLAHTIWVIKHNASQPQPVSSSAVSWARRPWVRFS